MPNLLTVVIHGKIAVGIKYLRLICRGVDPQGTQLTLLSDWPFSIDESYMHPRGGGGVLPIMTCTVRLRPKGIPFLGCRYMKG